MVVQENQFEVIVHNQKEIIANYHLSLENDKIFKENQRIFKEETYPRIIAGIDRVEAAITYGLKH